MKIIYTKEELTKFLSVAKYIGELYYAGKSYILLDEHGKAYKSTQQPKKGKPFKLGKVADLVDEKFVPYYIGYGREEFIKQAKTHNSRREFWLMSE